MRMLRMFGKIKALKEKVSGIKTYLVATVAIIGAVIVWSNDTITMWTMIQTILAAMATCTMRAAVEKSGPNA